MPELSKSASEHLTDSTADTLVLDNIVLLLDEPVISVNGINVAESFLNMFVKPDTSDKLEPIKKLSYIISVKGLLDIIQPDILSEIELSLYDFFNHGRYVFAKFINQKHK